MRAELERLKDALLGTPYQGHVWLVGGYVRDQLLGFESGSDIDLATELEVGPLVKLLHETGVSGPPQVYPRFQTAMVQIDALNLEFIQARKESYQRDSRKPKVVPGTMRDDAFRRDFTVNALSRNLHTGETADLTGLGLADLHAKLLRTPLDPETTLKDDPLRILRAVRFRWRLGFNYHDSLEQALRVSASRLGVISGERIREEMLKILSHPSAPEALADMMQLGLFHAILPEFEAMVGVEQGKYHHLDVWDHTLLVLRHAGCEDPILSLACLLHDIGKPQTRTVDIDGNTRFFQHERVGAEMVGPILRRLRWSSSDAQRVALLVRNHMRLASAPKLTPAAARRLVRDLGDELERLLLLMDADAKALKPGVRTLDITVIRARIDDALRAVPREKMVSPLDGDTIASLLSLEPGPMIGELKQALADRVLDGTLSPEDIESAKGQLEEIYRRIKAAKPPM